MHIEQKNKTLLVQAYYQYGIMREGWLVDPGTRYPKEKPLFLSVKPGMTVVVTEEESRWMGDVLYKEGGARNPKVPTLFQIACVDTGTIRWVNADLVTHIAPAV